MSDPVTNVPIEDVLSSIRKLVSEEVRAQVSPSVAGQVGPASSSAPASDKLILSPALRVVEGAVTERGDFDADEEEIAGFAPDAEPEDDDTAAVVLRPFEAMSRVRDRNHATPGGRSTDDADVLWDTEEAGEDPVAASHRMGEEDEGSAYADAAVDRRAPISEQPAGDLAVQDNDDDGALFDEYMLRDLVSEILRQELQGPLGERITRNVRKLVRAEIQRALNARDLY
ncbi:hypothetical protein DL237_05130 [Pseudooceanicola sediminis]|uniref:Uncharacterized protein n=1 Tax=Pseudooceanicola sediminis TaxID=2211117 RepID=A0A399JBQ6_9RHOB|nr:hypothetical protein [Pseudooceanicola sediminis]KAA2311459.1 hypothetical protein E0K93_20500 [Puniceibacterium sp. HSS470]RII40066.1 hypothetical protein DL237_05130 [Pseudooceanicola sediminis]|tara:strand:+ start:6328 stop:7011 length:684 start_codon:yes stop_codon:yes gene_type:complete